MRALARFVAYHGLLLAVAVSIACADSPRAELVIDPGEHVGEIFDLTFTPDSRHLISASEDAIRIWEVASGQSLPIQILNKERIPAMPLSVKLAPDGQTLAVLRGNRRDSPGGESAITLIDLGSGRISREWVVDLDTDRVKSYPFMQKSYPISFSPDGSVLAVVEMAPGGARQVKFWAVKSGECLQKLTFQLHLQEPLGSLAYSPDGRYLAASSDHFIGVWPLKNNQPKLSEFSFFDAFQNMRDNRACRQTLGGLSSLANA